MKLPEQNLTIPQAIEFLQISKTTFYRMKRDGKIPTVSIGGRVFVRPETLANIVAPPNESAGPRFHYTLYDADPDTLEPVEICQSSDMAKLRTKLKNHPQGWIQYNLI